MEFNFLGISNMPRNVRRRRYGGKMPLRVGLWSWAEEEGRKTLLHDVEHYRKTRSSRIRRWDLPTIRDAEAEALIRKLHRADYVGWTMDNTGESSELAVIDERLREQIEIVMRDCRIDPWTGPPNPARRATHHAKRISKQGPSAASPSPEAVTARAPHHESRPFPTPPPFAERITAFAAGPSPEAAAARASTTACKVFPETRDTNHGFFSKHGFFRPETRPFPWFAWYRLVLKPFSLVFSAPVC